MFPGIPRPTLLKELLLIKDNYYRHNNWLAKEWPPEQNISTTATFWHDFQCHITLMRDRFYRVRAISMNERIKAMNDESTDQPDAGESAPDVPPDRHVPPDEDASSGENVSPENAPSAEVPPEETIDVELSKEAVALPQPAHRALYNATAFAL